MKVDLRLVLPLFAAVSFSIASAQGPIPAPKPPGPSTPDMHLAVVVTAKRDQPVEQILPESDFTLLDNGVAQPIKSFRHVGSDAPVRVLIVIDAVNADYTTISYERQQLDRFLSSNGGELSRPTSLAILSDKGLQIQPNSTRDGKSIMAALDTQTTGLRTIGRDTGFYGAGERLDTSISALRTLIGKEGELPGRKLVIFISPGWALFSGPRIEISNKQQQGIFDQVVQLTRALQQANITLYSVDPRGTNQPLEARVFYQEFLKGVTKPQNTDFADLSLQVLATHSGGLVLNSNNFTPAPAEHPNEYHSIEVKVAQPGLTARTRQAYYAEP
jgi:VWFA-related protein